MLVTRLSGGVLDVLDAVLERHSLTDIVARPGMLVHFVDLANLTTLGGLALAFFACWAVLLEWPSLAMALAALAVVIDNVDGWIARRAVGRNPAFEYWWGCGRLLPLSCGSGDGSSGR
jgi:hypothetical protein